jgi:Tetratricopeptide repeat
MDRCPMCASESARTVVAVTLANLAAIDARRTQLDSAERRLRRALTLKERILGASHIELAATLATLADVRRRRGDAAQAGELFSCTPSKPRTPRDRVSVVARAVG